MVSFSKKEIKMLTVKSKRDVTVLQVRRPNTSHKVREIKPVLIQYISLSVFVNYSVFLFIQVISFY